ncbi:MAG: lipoate--protein ligase family protein, partial [Candidatus Zixiibacteriota bacterium]
MPHGIFYATFACDPFFNMAMDEWMFERVTDTAGAVMVRLYTWRPGAITFGFNQDEMKVVNHSRLFGTPLIRRVTGGRALYHEPSELTYSIAANLSHSSPAILSGSISQTNRNISIVLMKFLNELKIKTQYVRFSDDGFNDRKTFSTRPCFQSGARHEIVGENGKIIASAQRRIGNAFLQHGSIKINGVSNHPALPKVKNNSLGANSIRPIEKDDFFALANTFSRQMENSMG